MVWFSVIWKFQSFHDSDFFFQMKEAWDFIDMLSILTEENLLQQNSCKKLPREGTSHVQKNKTNVYLGEKGNLMSETWHSFSVKSEMEYELIWKHVSSSQNNYMN